MCSSIIERYLHFESQTIGPVAIAHLPRHLDDKTEKKFGSLKFIRGLTGPLSFLLAVTEEVYNLHFRIPEDSTAEAQIFRGQIFYALLENEEIWNHFRKGLEAFAQSELANHEAPLADGLRIIKDPTWLRPLATAAEGLRILDRTMWVSPIKRFLATLDANSNPDFMDRVLWYVGETRTLIAEIRQWLGEQEGSTSIVVAGAEEGTVI